jgi:replicative DNA helicase
MGKTALGARLILNSSDPSALLSSEMAVDQITLRMICSMAGISSRAIRQGMTREELDRWTRSSAEFLESPIYINDRPGITPDEIARQARKWKYHNGVKLVIIDYLQRLGGKPGQDRVERIREAIQAGKEMARQLDIHVVMLSQVSRDVERRDDKRPSMADFDGASTIEAEADHAIMIYRPAVYSNLAPKRLAELLVVKNRHGPIGTVVADFEPETVNFSPSNQPASPF